MIQKREEKESKEKERGDVFVSDKSRLTPSDRGTAKEKEKRGKV